MVYPPAQILTVLARGESALIKKAFTQKSVLQIVQLKNMNTPDSAQIDISPIRRVWQLLVSAVVIMVEWGLLKFYKNGLVPFSSEYSIRTYLDEYGGQQFWLATHIHYFFKELFCFLILMAMVWAASECRKPNFWHSIARNRVSIRLAILNLMSFGALLVMLMLVNDPRVLIHQPYSSASLIYIASPALWVLFMGSVTDILFPLKSLYEWAFKNRVLTIFILVITMLTIHQEWIEAIVNFWSDLLLQPTLDIALQVTQVMGLDAHLLPNGEHGPMFGTNRFVVEIWPACSGYEGMALMIALLATYCFLQRDHLRIKRALWIIPLASLAIFALNGIRIAVLIAIGHFYSPQLALDGFHVVGGWLNLLIVLVASLVTLNVFPYFLKNPLLPRVQKGEDLPFLLPLIVLMVAGLFDQIFNANFDWLYPIPILCSALAIIYYRSYLLKLIEKPSFTASVIGVLVFFIWIWLVPVDIAKSELFMSEISTAPLGFALFWLACRVIGAVLIVPIAEELAFRGFALPCLRVWLNNLLNKNILFKLSPHCMALIGTALSLALTSILFGMLHSDFLAGLLAGVGFGIAYLLRRKLIDAIVAHVVTNGLLAIYVIVFGYWSYW